ncbi:1-phosphatidylinositol-3-phosphate 5-kinase [Peziza echinospora]|nr:1-phosphatidylinositol-3-phosphate 5-kinase [Peziza echinospora]
MDQAAQVPMSQRRPSLTLSQLEVPITPTISQSTTIEQLHASNSGTTGLTSFSLGSPPATASEPLNFNKFFSKVKSVAAGVREAVRDAVVVAGPSSYKGEGNDSRESLESFASSSKGSPTTSNFNPRARPKRLSLSNASIMTKGSTGSGSGIFGGDVTSPSGLRKVSMFGQGSKAIPSPSLDKITVFRDGTGVNESSGGEGGASRMKASMAPFLGSSNSVQDAGIASQGGDEYVFSNKFAPLQGNTDLDGGPNLGGDGPGNDDFIGSASGVENGLASRESASRGGDRNNRGINPKSPQQLNSSGVGSNLSLPPLISSPPASMSSIPTALQPPQIGSNSRPGLGKRKDSTGGISPRNRSLRKRPKASKRTSESLLPGFAVNSESDTDEDYNSNSQTNASSIAGTNNGQRKIAQPQRTTSALSSVGGVRAIAGWFGVRGSSAEVLESDKNIASTTGGAVNGGGGNVEAVGLALQQLRKGNLTKEFWMKDENCKDCFLCGKTFTAFRRKHHCRLCGQIFCSKCTSTISGERFSYSGSMRVCNQCLEIVEGYKDESDPERQNFISHTSGTAPASENTVNTAFNMSTAHRPAITPLMAIPATRTTAGSNHNRRSAILEINSDMPSPPRPISARSMKAQIVSSRPMTAASFKHSYQHNHNHHHPHHAHYHKHTHSRSVHKWPGQSNPNERAPFHRNAADDMIDSMNTLPAFHSDSIIDPELAPYMSDQDATDDEQMSIFATIGPRHSDAHGLSGSSSVPNNGQQSSLGEKQLAAIASNSASGASGNKISKALSLRNSASGMSLGGEGSNGRNTPHTPTKQGKRAQTYIGSPQVRPITRTKPLRGIMRQIPSTADAMNSRGNISAGSPRTSRSSSMRGMLPQSVELNTVSLQHVQKLLKQLLQDANIQDVEKWEQALMPILLKSTDDLNPDVRAGDVIDIRHYIKVKRIPGGKQKDTSYISGVVFTKNLALKSMPRTISQPRIVIVTFPIEYQRSQQFMSLEPVIAQEKEFLQNMVNRITALRPTLLLVGENISGLALQYLAAANIATAYHVKDSVIEAVARCAQADLFSSVDKLALPLMRVGRCAKFEVKTFVHDDIPNRKKTFMFLSGCARELGCTIVLRGADMETLSQIKQITEMMVYVVYNLKLETCLMRDEYIMIPSTPRNAQPDPLSHQSQTSLPNISTSDENQIQGIDGETTPHVGEQSEIEETTNKTTPTTEIKSPEATTAPSYYEDMVKKHETKILSASPFVKYQQPYLLTRARELEKKLIALRALRDRLATENSSEAGEDKDKSEMFSEKYPNSFEKEPEKFELIQPEMVRGGGKTTRGATEILRAIYDVEYEKALHVYETQKRHWENYLAQYDDLFDPYAHQNIVFLYTMVCTITSVPCEGPEIRRLVFYDQGPDWPIGKSDCTLGQYIEYLCDTCHESCTAGRCEKKMSDHHRSYVHGQARVSVLVNAKMPGPVSNGISMWSYCKFCTETSTPAMPMSESTWKYSFAKYLELAFWSSELKLRSLGGAQSCPHDMSRDHVRCFAYRGKTVVFQHDPIELLEIFVPRTRITYKPELDLKVKNDQYLLYEEKINRFITSVRTRLMSIKVETVAPEKHEACKAEIERLLKNLDEEQAWLIAKLQEKYTKSKYYEIIPMNRAMRAMQEKTLDWDLEFQAFDNNFFPSEKDIRRLAALQLRKIFLDPQPTLNLPNEETTAFPGKDEATKPSVDGASTPSEKPSSPIDLSSQATQDALASVMEEDAADSEIQEKRGFPFDKDATSAVSVPGTISEVGESARLDKDANSVTGNDPPSMTSGEVQGMARDKNIDTDSGSIADAPKPEERPIAAPVQPLSSETLQSLQDSASELVKSLDLENSTVKGAPMIPEIIIPEVIKLEGRPSASPAPTPPSSTGAGPRRKSNPPPPFNRAHSVSSVLQPRKISDSGPSSISQGRKTSEGGQNSSTPGHSRTSAIPVKKVPEGGRSTSKVSDKPKGEKKNITDRLRTSLTGKKGRDKDVSMIPRPFQNKLHRRDAKNVSSLTKHFEQLSREFEQERAREKKQLAAIRTKVYPVMPTKPFVEVYSNVDDAVEEFYEDDEAIGPLDLLPNPTIDRTEEPHDHDLIDNLHKPESPVNLAPDEQLPQPASAVQDDEPAPPVSQPHSDAESDAESSTQSDHESTSVPSMQDVLPPAPQMPLDSELKELPKHERSSLMNILSKFWAERSASGWASLDYPLAATEHIFADSDVIVREDEPSSLIAFTLRSQDYASKLESIRLEDDEINGPFGDHGEHGELERSMLKQTGTHIKYQFSEGSAKMYCKIFFAEQFDALRKNCGVEDRFAESLSRCTKWDSKGGKSKSVFLKTLDDRIIMKALQPVETAAFLKFAPAYFRFMSEAFFHELPTVIAKMLGFYQIYIKNPVTGTEIKWDVLVMENLFYDRKTTRIFDLKGSMRNRYTHATGDSGEVLLDENMVEFIYETPLFVREHAKKLLRASLWNDTLFLAKQNVMDYSLMIGLDEGRKELVVGIIDCIRTFTWDKKLESWVKDLTGGGRNIRPTVTSPKEYKHRFREAMERYILEAPSCWHLFRMNWMSPVKVRLQANNNNSTAPQQSRDSKGTKGTSTVPSSPPSVSTTTMQQIQAPSGNRVEDK